MSNNESYDKLLAIVDNIGKHTELCEKTHKATLDAVFALSTYIAVPSYSNATWLLDNVNDAIKQLLKVKSAVEPLVGMAELYEKGATA